MTRSVRLSGGRLIRVGLSFTIFQKGGKIHFHAPIGALANSYDNYADIYFRNKQVNKNVLEDMTTFQLK